MTSVEFTIWGISIATVLMTTFVAWQAWRLGSIMNSSFGKWETVAWVIAIIYRIYGLAWLSTDISQLRRAGYLTDSLTFNQWFNVSVYFIFLAIMSYSKHLKRKRIKEAWGELDDEDKTVKSSIDKLTDSVKANTETGLRIEAAAEVVATNLAESHAKADATIGEPGSAADAAVQNNGKH